MITDFCGRFESDFPLAFRWSGLKPIGYSMVESFDEGVGFRRLKKEVADLEGRCERLLFGVGGPSRFGDQSLISELH